jgi:deazaflavin-dependent oxidoreductase (nitroreductase family)
MAMKKAWQRIRQAGVSAAASPAGSWFIINVSAKVDPPLLKATKGYASSFGVTPVLLLTHTGAKTGQRRETPLVYVRDGDDLVLVASKGGDPSHPAWYHNLTANPRCEVVVKGRSGTYEAAEVTGAERDRLWAKAVDLYPGYETYQARTNGRLIPLVRLRRLRAE